jgi:hypothetical protein
MILVEPDSCWRDRLAQQRLRAQEETRRRNSGRLHPIQADLLYLVQIVSVQRPHGYLSGSIPVLAAANGS